MAAGAGVETKFKADVVAEGGGGRLACRLIDDLRGFDTVLMTENLSP